MDYDYLLKIILIGDSGVGKSTSLIRYVDDTFQDSYISTIGVDFKIRTVEHNGKMVKLQIWDTAGQERFRTITSSYYRNAHAIMLYFDLTDRDSFYHLAMWLTEIQKYASEEVTLILIGTKADLIHRRVISAEEIAVFCREHKIEYQETSAKTSDGIEVAFNRITQLSLKVIQPEVTRKSVVLMEERKVKKPGCC